MKCPHCDFETLVYRRKGQETEALLELSGFHFEFQRGRYTALDEDDFLICPVTGKKIDLEELESLP